MAHEDEFKALFDKELAIRLRDPETTIKDALVDILECFPDVIDIGDITDWLGDDITHVLKDECIADGTLKLPDCMTSPSPW